ncbi:hypothetical protein [Gorillibacterium timonense]|uniref:hypothetical protein n=1 Tax=Gorillibacterium timonense TaxID=1689269 RepID=UPI00071DFF06|nr:hypothetical protein [Gorillibacterium timonense]
MGTSQTPVLESARPTVLSAHLERLEAEHAELSLKLSNWSKAAQCADSPIEGVSLDRTISNLRIETSVFMDELEAHLAWGRSDLFPLIGTYAGADLLPTLNPSLWGLDKNYELAKRYVTAFQKEAAVTGANINSQVVQELSSHLLHAAVILKDYLAMEKNLLFPIAEDLLTDLDYLFS